MTNESSFNYIPLFNVFYLDFEENNHIERVHAYDEIHAREKFHQGHDGEDYEILSVERSA
jgi:hypothetical protein